MWFNILSQIAAQMFFVWFLKLFFICSKLKTWNVGIFVEVTYLVDCHSVEMGKDQSLLVVEWAWAWMITSIKQYYSSGHPALIFGSLAELARLFSPKTAKTLALIGHCRIIPLVVHLLKISKHYNSYLKVLFKVSCILGSIWLKGENWKARARSKLAALLNPP